MPAKFLSTAEQADLAYRWKEFRCERSAEKLLTAFYPMIRKAAWQYTTDTCPVDDLVQEGKLAFLEALDKFDPAKGAHIGVYAKHHLRFRLSKHALETRSAFRLPRSRRTQRMLNCLSEIEGERCRKGDILSREKAAICDRNDFSVDEIEELEGVIRAAKSVDELRVSSGGKEKFIDTIRDENAVEGEDILRHESMEAVLQLIEAEMAKLSEREKTAIVELYCSDGELIGTELGKKLNVSRSTALKALQKGIGTIRQRLQDRGINAMEDIV